MRSAALDKAEKVADIKAFNDALMEDDGIRYSTYTVVRMAMKGEWPFAVSNRLLTVGGGIAGKIILSPSRVLMYVCGCARAICSELMRATVCAIILRCCKPTVWGTSNG